MGARDSNGRLFTKEELEAQMAGLQTLQFRLLTVSPSEFSVLFLRQAHTDLSGGVQSLHPGEIRIGDITFGSHYGTRPEHIHQELEALMKFHHEHWDDAVLYDEVAQHAAKIHAELIRIHPMADGNGRLSRSMEAWLCWQGGIPAPTYPDRSAYYAAISKYILYNDLRPLQTAAQFRKE